MSLTLRELPEFSYCKRKRTAEFIKRIGLLTTFSWTTALLKVSIKREGKVPYLFIHSIHSIIQSRTLNSLMLPGQTPQPLLVMSILHSNVQTLFILDLHLKITQFRTLTLVEFLIFHYKWFCMKITSKKHL